LVWYFRAKIGPSVFELKKISQLRSYKRAFLNTNQVRRAALILFKMKKIHLPMLLMGILCLCACKHNEEEPTNGEEQNAYRKYYEATRRAALGDNWEQITNDNLESATQSRLFPKEAPFAGGLLQGDWFERGSSNVAGNTVATYFYPATEQVYAISNTGTLYRGGLTGAAWTILSDAINFNANTLAIVPITGGKRIITSKKDKKIHYSDDEGATWTEAAGISYTGGAWGEGGQKLTVLNNGILYFLVHTQLDAPDVFGSGYKLFRSADNGATWTTAYTFNSREHQRVSMWSPFGSNELYALDNGTALYSLSGMASTLTLLNNNMTIGENLSYVLTGYKNGAALTLYALSDNKNLYKSTDNGAVWATISTLSPKSWEVGIAASPWTADALFYGEVEFFKSTTVTPSFAIQNTWGDYYPDIDKLHADIVSMTPFQKTDGTRFFLIGNHGGIHYYPEPYTTTTNLTKTGFRNTDYYDVITIGGTIFAGTQDQGDQRFTGSAGTNILTATQITSGDYVRLNSSVNNTKYWREYPYVEDANPYCSIIYYDSPLTTINSDAEVKIYGTSANNIQYWSVPTCNWSVAADNSILVGGGGTTLGATTSKLIKLTSNGSSIATSAYAYDFKANGSGYITAVEHSPANANYMYVGLNNGKFYYSHNAGTTWTQTASFTGPTNIHTYGSFIHASRTNALLAFYCGGGGQIYKTIDGGVNFTSMSTNLPNTFVSDLALNTAETLLFAATDMGPYVCVLATGQWYSLASNTTPVKAFKAVEWVASSNIARFATFGRGVWDFQITAQPLPITYTTFDAKAVDNQHVSLTWETGMESQLSHFEIEKSYDGIHFSQFATVKANNKASRYAALDNQPVFGVPNYYRIKSVELDGKTALTTIKTVLLNSKLQVVNVYPTMLNNGGVLNVQNDVADRQLYLFDHQGRIVFQQKLTNQNSQLTLPTLPNGVYHYAIRERNQSVVKSGKLMVL
jgi:hypothetical protein